MIRPQHQQALGPLFERVHGDEYGPIRPAHASALTLERPPPGASPAECAERAYALRLKADTYELEAAELQWSPTNVVRRRALRTAARSLRLTADAWAPIPRRLS